MTALAAAASLLFAYVIFAPPAEVRIEYVPAVGSSR